MKLRPSRAFVAISGLVWALALAGCAGAPHPATETSMPSSYSAPRFSQVDGANVAFAEFKNSAFPYHGVDPGRGRPLEVAPVPQRRRQRPARPFLARGTACSGRIRPTTIATCCSPPRPISTPTRPARWSSSSMATTPRSSATWCERQQTVRQLAQANLNAVLVAPQMAVDAADSSAGNFWRPGAFAQFLDEADGKLAALYPQRLARRVPPHAGDPRRLQRRLSARRLFARLRRRRRPHPRRRAVRRALWRARQIRPLDRIRNRPGVLRQRLFRLVEGRATSRCRRASSATAFPPRAPCPPSSARASSPSSTRATSSHDDFVSVAWTSDPLRDVLSRVAQ